MQELKYNYGEIALLVTVYNRSASLKRLLNSFRELNVTFGEIIVSDDCSKEPHLSLMKELQQDVNFKLVTTPINKGLGNNINKGQKAVSLPYTLYIQEDFVPKQEFLNNLKNALSILKEDVSVDTIRFYAYFPYPYTKTYGKGFNEMIFEPSLFKWDHLKFYVYSDHPHLRRSSFLDKFGSYVEGRDVNYTEFQMCLAYIKQQGRGLVTPAISDIFDQLNSPDEPSTANRSSWKVSRNLVVRFMRRMYLVYRYLKNNVQLWRKK